MSSSYKCRTVSKLLVAIKECANRKDLKGGKTLHWEVLEAGRDTNKYLATALINMYCKCRCTRHAQYVFDNITRSDAFLWNSLLLGYVENGESFLCLDSFQSMDCEPDCVTFVAALKACTSLAIVKHLDRQFCLEKGMGIHRQAREFGFDNDFVLATALLEMYSKCGSMLDARTVFDTMIHRDVISWTTLIMGYVENGESFLAVELFASMDCEPDSFTFVAALKACGCLTFMERGMDIHRQARERGLDGGIFVANTLVDMYRKCSSMQRARAVFDKMVHRDVISWNSIILGYVENKESLEALELFESMDCEPDSVSFVAALKACAGLGSEKHVKMLDKGMGIHRQARELGLHKEIFVANTLIDMYSKCGSIRDARAAFDNMRHWDVVSWNSLILGYVENDQRSVAVDLFMRNECKPNALTFSAVLKGCVSEKQVERLSCLQNGIVIHRKAKEQGFDTDVIVASSLVEMYSKCGAMSHARGVFDNIHQPDVVLYNILIMGYVENGESFSAMNLFSSIDCEPDDVTFVAVLKACESLGGLGRGRAIHAQVSSLGFEDSLRLANCLVDFYGKCGNILAAQYVFDAIHHRDIVSWNALIAGYSSRGDICQVFNLIRDMQESGLQMNSITFVSVLTACSHAGMVKEGTKCFESMSVYGIRPGIEHYACVIDMLGRANRLEEALSIVDTMPFRVNDVVWTTLLGTCRNGDNWGLGIVKSLHDKQMVIMQ